MIANTSIVSCDNAGEIRAVALVFVVDGNVYGWRRRVVFLGLTRGKIRREVIERCKRIHVCERLRCNGMGVSGEVKSRLGQGRIYRAIFERVSILAVIAESTLRTKEKKSLFVVSYIVCFCNYCIVDSTIAH